MSEPWYRDGLRFRCTRCGSCCTGEPGNVWVTDEEIAAIAAFRGETVEQVRGWYTRTGRRGRSLRG
jgi:Fe-S-cluster containining protein